MAFGNGAPEISASASAIIAGGDTANLGLGTLLGTSILIPIMSAGIIAVIVKDAKVSATPFLRDCFFLFLATGCILGITTAKRMTMIQAIGLVAIYILYVLSVVSGELYKKWRLKFQQAELERVRRRKISAINHIEIEQSRTMTDRIMPIVGVYAFEVNPLASTSRDYIVQNVPIKLAKNKTFPRKDPLIITHDDERESSMTVSKLKKKIDKERESEMSFGKKLVLNTLKIPIFILDLLWRITIPLTDEHHWNDWIAVLSCIVAPIWIQFAFAPESISEFIGDSFPVVGVVAVIGFEMALFTLWRVRRKYRVGKIHNVQTQEVQMQLSHLSKSGFTINDDETDDDAAKKEDERIQKLKRTPVMKYFFIFLGFLSAVGWLRKTADELVNLMSTLGIVSTIDTALLALTVLSWGMSMHDLMAIVSVSKRGYTKMGISASIGGPTFNLLIGVGIGGFVGTIKSSDSIMIMPFTLNIFASCICCMLGIFTFSIWTAINKWTLGKSFGFFCILYYAAYLVTIGVIYRFT